LFKPLAGKHIARARDSDRLDAAKAFAILRSAGSITPQNALTTRRRHEEELDFFKQAQIPREARR
jgi:hypothetical protein